MKQHRHSNSSLCLCWLADHLAFTVFEYLTEAAMGESLLLHEEAATTLVGWETYLATKGTGLRVAFRQFHRKAETLNGADFDFWFALKGRAFGWRVQAKRLERATPTQPARYLKVGHTSAHGRQVDLLIGSCGSVDLAPFYWFYNFGLERGCLYRHCRPADPCHLGRVDWRDGIVVVEAAKVRDELALSSRPLPRKKAAKVGATLSERWCSVDEPDWPSTWQALRDQTFGTLDEATRQNQPEWGYGPAPVLVQRIRDGEPLTSEEELQSAPAVVVLHDGE